MPSFSSADRYRFGNRTPLIPICSFNPGKVRPHTAASLESFLESMPINALAARLAIGIAKLRGQDLDHLPRPLFWKLYDLAADGDPSARLIYAWLGAPTGNTPPPIQTPHAPPFPTFRHGRFWISLASLDQAEMTCGHQLREIARCMEGV